MTAQQYCRYIFRKNRLPNLIKIVVNCCFSSDDYFTLQKRGKKNNDAVETEHIGLILQQMLEEQPTRRITLEEAFTQF